LTLNAHPSSGALKSRRILAHERLRAYVIKRVAFRRHKSGAVILCSVLLVIDMAEGGDAAAGGGRGVGFALPERFVFPQRSGLPVEAFQFAMEEWFTMPRTHVCSGWRRVIVDHPPHRDHGRVGTVVCVNRSGAIGLILFDGEKVIGDPVVYWPILMSVLRSATVSDAAIVSLSDLESFGELEIDAANVTLARAQFVRRRDRYRGEQAW